MTPGTLASGRACIGRLSSSFLAAQTLQTVPGHEMRNPLTKFERYNRLALWNNSSLLEQVQVQIANRKSAMVEDWLPSSAT